MAALGRIGIILALEVSPLARSNGDWYQLLDVCAVAGILIADEEGLYDPTMCPRKRVNSNHQVQPRFALGNAPADEAVAARRWTGRGRPLQKGTCDCRKKWPSSPGVAAAWGAASAPV